MEWADLPIIDISKAATPEGRAELAPIARDAMHTHGFVYVVNHGLTQAQVRSCALMRIHYDCLKDGHQTMQNDRIFDIADVVFSQVSDEEKKQYRGKIKETGLYSGYKLREYWVQLPHKNCVDLLLLTD